MDRQDSLRKWIFSALLVAAGVLLSPLFSFPLGVTRAFPLQHMINIFLAVLCGTRFSTSAAFGTALIRNILGTGSLLAFPGSMIGAFLSGYLYSSGALCLVNSSGLRLSAAWFPIRLPLFSWVLRRVRSSMCPSSPFPAAPAASSLSVF